MQQLKTIRKTKKLTQSQFAELLGMSQGALSKTERGLLELSYSHIKILRKKLGLNINKVIDQDTKGEMK